MGGSVLTFSFLRAVRKFVKMPFGLGELPKEYNLKVHGPYDPAVYYGPKDTPLGQVKVKELPGWLARRGKGPIAIGRATSRGATSTSSPPGREWQLLSSSPLDGQPFSTF